MSTEPPFVLDAARVIEYAPFDMQIASGRASAVLGGVAVDLQNVAGLAIVEDLARGTLFLLYCNKDWETVAADAIVDLGAGKALAENSFTGTARLWTAYRELTPAEQAEVDSTKKFLRELLADDPES